MNTHRRPHRTAQRSLRRRVGLGITVIVLFLVGIVLVQGIRVGIQLRNAYEQGKQFAYFMRGDLTPERYTMAQSLLGESATAFASAEANFAPFVPLLQRLGWVPWIGEDLTAIPILFQAGHDLVKVGVQGFQVAKPILLAPPGSSPFTQIPPLFQQSQTEVAAISAAATTIETDLQQIRTARLSPLLSETVSELQAAVAMIAPGLRLSAYLPTLMGVGQTRTYLVLAQNNHELRGTGGFVTAVGRITMADGRVVGMEFVDSYDPAFNRTDLPLPHAPQPMAQYMGIEVMLLRDVNWSPDFPTTAQVARTIYNQQTGRTVDGVITVDLQAVEQIVTALEPLKVAGIDQPMTGATVVEQIRTLWAAPPDSTATLASGDPGWWAQRKDFIPKLAESAIARIQRGDFDYLRMLSAIQTSLSSRAIQLWFADTALAGEVAKLDWDGGLRLGRDGDFLAIVDSNFGYNKVNAVIQQNVDYRVEWPTTGSDQRGLATLEIHYRHPIARDGYVCDQTPHYDGSYEEMMVRCYFDYLRIYTPAGSELIGIEGVLAESIINQRGEAGAQLFGGYFILSPGETTTVRLQYHLPTQVTPENYALTVRRQAGTPPLALVATVGQQRLDTTVSTGLLHWQPTADSHVIVAAQP